MELDLRRRMGVPSGRVCLARCAALAIGSPAQAQSVAELAAYSGADRTQRLIAGARKENALMIYSSMTVADMGALINAFQAKYGVKAQHWRGSSEDIRNRVTREYSASRYDADLAETAGTDMEAMVREQVLQKVTTPVSKELIPQATFAHGQWIATRLSVFAAAYNTNIIKRADAPKTYEDLLNPRFKGKLAIEAEDANWFMAVVLSHGRREGPQALPRHRRPQRHVDPEGPHAAREPGADRRGAARAHRLQLSGGAAQERRRADRDRLPAARRLPFRPASACSGARRIPHAALLFQDFILTDGQKILAEREAVPTNPKVKAAPDGLIFVDLPRFMDEGSKWTKLFRDTFTVR